MINKILQFLGLDKDGGERLVRRYWILVLACGPTYAIWMLCFKHLFIPFFNENIPKHDDVIATHMLIKTISFGSLFFPLMSLAILILAKSSKRVEQNLYIAYQILVYSISVHYLLIVNEGNLHEIFVMGVFVLVFAVSYMMATARSGAAYATFMTLASIVLITRSNPLTPKGFFVLGQITICGFAFVTIADRRRFELKDKKRIAELTESKELLRLSVDATGVATWQFDVKSDCVLGSAQYFKNIGLPEDTKFIKNSDILEKFIHPEDLPLLMESFTRAYTNKAGETIEYRMITTSGEIRWFETTGHVHVNKKGEVISLLGTTVDVTARKETEFKERNARENLELALVAGKMGTIDMNMKTGHIVVSENRKQMFGIKSESPTLEEFLNLIHPEDREKLKSVMVKYRTSNASEYRDEYRVIHPKLGIRWISDSGRVFRDKKGNPVRYIGVTQDITEERMKEQMAKDQQEALFHSAQLSALGEMAAGIAHEINTPTSSIRLRAQNVQMKIARNRPLDGIKGTMDQIIEDVDRCTEIIKGLKILARAPEISRGDIMVTNFAPDDPIKQVLSLCRQKFSRSGIKLKVNHDHEGDCVVKFSSQMISQVILNLMNNAYDAVMASDHENKTITINITKSESFCKIAISDNGNGIPQEIQDKIFRPFFTTKEASKGTGLGLSISKTIMEKGGGDLVLDKNSKETTFVISIPLAEQLEEKAA